jgi:hypothetical protein
MMMTVVVAATMSMVVVMGIVAMIAVTVSPRVVVIVPLLM